MTWPPPVAYREPIRHSESSSRPRPSGAAASARALGLLGGTFDPPHRGHLRIARRAMRRLKLAGVVFIPSATPPHKAGRCLTRASDRLRMVRLAVRRLPGFRVSPIELRRTGPSFTLDTIRRLRRRFPRRRFCFLVGADTVPELKSWRRYRSLIRQVEFVALARPGYRLRVPRELEGCLRLLPGRNPDISSSRLREALARGERRPRGLPPPVADYIRRRGLYRSHDANRDCASRNRRYRPHSTEYAASERLGRHPRTPGNGRRSRAPRSAVVPPS